jgi:hypothetical protein
MPVLALCRCCGRETLVPDAACGMELWCPRCSGFFRVRRRKVQTDVPLRDEPGGTANVPCSLSQAAGRCVPARTPGKNSLSVSAAPGLAWILTHLPQTGPATRPRQMAAAAPFVATCPFCGRQCHVPSQALAKKIGCARCWSFFVAAPTLAAAVEAAALLGRTAFALPPPVPSGAASAVETAQQQITVAMLPPAPLPKARPAAPIRPLPSPPAYGRRRVEPFGAAALLLACAAFLCAAFRPLAGWLVPLALIALVAGIRGMVRTRRTDRFHRGIPVAGTAVALAVLLIGWFFPGLLGPHFQSPPVRHADPQRQAIFRMTLPGDSRTFEPNDPIWANAARFALCQENVTVQVMEVICTEPGCLQVRVRITGPEHRGLLKEENRPTLKDEPGSVYRLQKVEVVRPLDEDAEPGTQLAATDVVCTFTIPRNDLPALRLELPAAACGGTGVYRFLIPKTMIQRR